MKKLILCEGKIDAVMIGCYLGKVTNWTQCKKAPKGLEIEPNFPNQFTKWYCQNSDKLLICAVGGKDNFKNFFEDKIKSPLFDSDAFEKIAIVIDRDDRETQEILDSVNSALESLPAGVQDNKWVPCLYKNSSQEEKSLEVLLVIVPENQGALEKVLLESISENNYDKKIVEKTEHWAEEMYDEARRYVSKPSLIPKVHLGLTLAIKYPTIAFTSSEEQITKVPWEKYDKLNSCFSELIKI